MANRDTTITLLLKGNAATLNAALQQSSRQVRGFATEAERAASRSHRQFDHIRASVASISTQLAQAKTQLFAFVGLQGVGDAVGRLVRAADSYANLSAKIKLATTSQAGFNQAEAAVFAIAQRTSTQLDSTATLFGRLTSALKDQGGSQREGPGTDRNDQQGTGR
ncbi:tape measure protein, partial [Lysobacter firmicutimachus]